MVSVLAYPALVRIAPVFEQGGFPSLNVGMVNHIIAVTEDKWYAKGRCPLREIHGISYTPVTKYGKKT